MTYRIRLAKYHADAGNAAFGRSIIDALLKTKKAIEASPSDPAQSVEASPSDPGQSVGPVRQIGRGRSGRSGPTHHAESKESIIVLVPVYDDFDTSRDCIEALLASREHNQCTAHLLLINDASPNPT